MKYYFFLNLLKISLELRRNKSIIISIIYFNDNFL